MGSTDSTSRARGGALNQPPTPAFAVHLPVTARRPPAAARGSGPGGARGRHPSDTGRASLGKYRDALFNFVRVASGTRPKPRHTHHAAVLSRGIIGDECGVPKVPVRCTKDVSLTDGECLAATPELVTFGQGRGRLVYIELPLELHRAGQLMGRGDGSSRQRSALKRPSSRSASWTPHPDFPSPTENYQRRDDGGGAKSAGCT